MTMALAMVDDHWADRTAASSSMGNGAGNMEEKD